MGEGDKKERGWFVKERMKADAKRIKPVKRSK
jgi:hypothetical protein